MLSSPPPSPPPPSSPFSSDPATSPFNPSILIIGAIIAAAITSAAGIHLLLRFLSRSRSPSIHHVPSSPSSTSDSSSTSSSTSSLSSAPTVSTAADIIASLPIFSLSSSRKSTSAECAVCLSPFHQSDELRLLPSCRHVFHSRCIDAWLESNLTCPLCRSSIRHVSPSASFKLELGSSVGSLRSDEAEIDGVMSRIVHKRENSTDVGSTGPGDDVAEGVGGRGSWLKEYIDRLTSSASSSFSSLRWSSRRNNGSNISNQNNVNCYSNGNNESDWDLETNLHLHLEEEDGGFAAFYRWLVGA